MLLYLKHTAGCQISTLIFWFFFWGNHINILWKLQTDGKVLPHVGFKSKVLPEYLSDLRTWVGFCTSRLKQGVKYHLWYFDFFLGIPINIPWKIANGPQSSFSLDVQVRGIVRALNGLMVKFCSKMSCSGTFRILKIATSFPEFQYL